MKPHIALLAFLAACGGSSTDTGPRDGKDPADTSDDVPVVEAMPAGHKPLHRLNRAELDNTIHDLFDTELSVAEDLPRDESAHGYDNVAEALNLSPVHFELLEVGVDRVLDELFGRVPESTQRQGMQAEGPGPTYVGGSPTADGYALALDGESLQTVFTAQYGGLFRVGVWVRGGSGDDEAAEFTLHVDGEDLGTWPAYEGDYELVEAELELEPGLHTVSIHLANPGEIETLRTQRRVVVDLVAFEGPLDPQLGPTDAYYRIVHCDPGPDVSAESDEATACARQVIQELGLKAWRRPLDEAEITQLHSLYLRAAELGLPFDEALQLSVKALLLSPDFVYRVEQDPAEEGDRPLTGYELASRLSYFLWSSAPDDALLEAAEDGTLVDPEVTAWHVRRMLKDPRAHALVDNFVAQWWDIRDLEHGAPDPSLYGNWSPELGHSMATEMMLLGESFFLEDRDLRDLLDTDVTRVDARLAAHYGLPAPSEPWAEVSLQGTPRRGLLGMAGWATVQAHPDRPSAVRRGKWVLENLLCSPPPPPPPEAEGLDVPDPFLGSVRSQEESRRADTYCQNCHQAMDPIGFSMGHLDASGAVRAIDELGFPIDGSATLIDGTQVRSMADLSPWLASHPEVPGCMVEQVATYALGRPLGEADAPALDAVETAFLAGDARFEALALAIVASPMFRERTPSTDLEEAP